MPFEIKVSVNVFSPATTQVLIGPPPSTFNNCYQCLNLVIFAVQLYLIWLSVPRATSNTPTAGEAVFISSTQNLAARGPNALACQCCAPQSEPPTQVVVQEAADATVGQETPSQRPSTKDRGPVAQAPEPPKQIETQTGADQPSSSASVTHCRSPRGSNQLVVRPPDSPSLLPPGTGIPEKPSSACPLSPVHPNVENASTPEQNDDGPTSNYLFQPSPTGTQDPVTPPSWFLGWELATRVYQDHVTILN
ncbi:hypothetical protein FRC09_010874 [Ceratobasidium sp. 395]|nr:hypothetical protein FRC09_010874 [Ceratobasidium sp. 395]